MKRYSYLTLGGLFLALHVVFILACKFLPIAAIILVVELPLLSSIYTLKYGVREVSIFVIAAIALCLVISPIDCLVYVIPALFCGVIYGSLRKKGVKKLALFYASSLSHSLALLGCLGVLYLLFKTAYSDSFFGFIYSSNKPEIVYSLLLLLGTFEAFITQISSEGELKRMNFPPLEEEEKAPLWLGIAFVCLAAIYIVFAILVPVITLYIFPFLLMGIVPFVVEFITRNKYHWVYLFSGIIAIGTVPALSFTKMIYFPGFIIAIALPIALSDVILQLKDKKRA